MPKIVDHDVVREKVAEATWRVIADKGIDAATTRLIAKEAQCSTGVLAHYFQDKDELLLFALRLASMRTGRRMEARVAEAGSKVEALRNVLCESLPLDKARRLEWQIWVSFWGRAAGSASMAKEQKRRYVEWRCFVRGLIAEGQAGGELRTDLDASDEADSLIGLVDGLGIQATLEPRRLPAKRLRALVDRHIARLLPSSD
jgi:AcrR family transcriptional regulator